ncbi:unnamed protein product [Rotaria sp. Silwood2]|nr:unnamed protein product [Rotaria sp. Silwood2]CAF2917598.1 unnamed protein product [Rotaria sp. Silwood2]CAF3860058.1 unnamed protein product [Rotaria sp. Silwood2]CAF4109342.1 unnamed protein product [Rotaria sp. Silwood2]
MNLVYRALLIIICLGIRAECQGGGGGGSFSGGSFTGGIFYYGNAGGSCKGNNCSGSTSVVLGILGGIIGFVLLVWGIYYCVKSSKGRPSQTNVIFVQKETNQNYELEKSDINIFKSGYWKSQYFQYGNWHGSHRFSLTFNDLSMNITGSGSDDVGTFTIHGTYSVKTRRIGLTKTYKKGTGNPSQNLGHQVTIQLTWNAQNNQFEGKWYVQTSKYYGENKFELKFDGQHIQTVYEKL